MPEFFADGVSIHYEKSGLGPKHIVLVHAYPTHSRMWDPQQAALGAGRVVVTYDVRGMGRSGVPSQPAAYSQDRSVADLLSLLDHLGVQRADICGLSMGGNIALNFALAHPDRVDSLVISGTGSGSDDRATFIERTIGWAETAERYGIETFADKVLENDVFSEYANRGARERAHMRGLIVENSAKGVALTARYVIAARPPIPALEARMNKLDLPTLVIAGASDGAVSFPTQIMARAIPRAQLKIIPRTGHFNNIEEPDAVNNLLRTFLHF
ncbi:MAG: alpha/beta fold hydrolase [Rhizobiales bacterium]|nr:alpha/beta fold hydrolase [Hyphomicrobiales bacterium]